MVNQNLNSRIGFNGIIRKIYYLMLVGSVYLLSVVIPGIEYAGDGAAIAFCVLV
ncbi:phage holin family protein [Lysinibacillus sphaericus]|uniref:phage holin family protein n=1 Tax=Lysinibacillus TaxID=400634 RepID=UPI003AF379B0